MKKVGVLRDVGRNSTIRPRSTELEQLLYVEDDDSNWQVAQLHLRAGYDLTRAANAEQACRVLALRGKRLAAILMDIELRGSDLNGLELTQLIRGKLSPERRPAYAAQVPVLETPIIFMTAHGTDYPGPRLMLAGGQRVLGKPVNFSELSLALTNFHLERMGQRGR
jgi:CheY-like chemotaxis protein